MTDETPGPPRTQIGSTHSRTDTLTIRGRDTLSEIVGEKTFTETFFFIVTGRMPSPGETQCFDACLNVLMDHGLTPSALVARLTEDSVPEDMQVSVAAGLLLDMGFEPQIRKIIDQIRVSLGLKLRSLLVGERSSIT